MSVYTEKSVRFIVDTACTSLASCWMCTEKNERKIHYQYRTVAFIVNVCKNKGDGVQTQIDELRRNDHVQLHK